MERYQKSAAKTLVVFCHYPVDYLYVNLEFLVLVSKQLEAQHRLLRWTPPQHRLEWAVDLSEHTVARGWRWRLRLRRWSAGLREGLLLGGRDCDDGGETREDSDCCFFVEREDSIPASATGIVDVVVCEGGNCTTSVLGQGICTRIHETKRSHCSFLVLLM